jgi:hypothetical protein
LQLYRRLFQFYSSSIPILSHTCALLFFSSSAAARRRRKDARQRHSNSNRKGQVAAGKNEHVTSAVTIADAKKAAID